ncbi:hypothetical protein [Candidatus Agathobaculum pullicola]|uniref:hypothetical protein n=1 Tax=Candidatus Agathobaculum pullicola TaxID=2838426 RepID=UPI003F90FBE5
MSNDNEITSNWVEMAFENVPILQSYSGYFPMSSQKDYDITVEVTNTVNGIMDAVFSHLMTGISFEEVVADES